MSRLGKLVALNALACLLLAAVLLAGIEIWLRLTIPASSGGSIFEYTLETPRYKRMKPNARIVAWGEELTTNQLGFRDDAPTLGPKRKDEFRIIALGDSFTVSAGVAFDRIWTSLVVALLPSTWHFDRQRPLFDRVLGFCRQHELSCLDFLEPFMAAEISGA